MYCDMNLMLDTKHLQITKMEGNISCSDQTNTTTSSCCPAMAMVMSPCAACKILRRRCIADKCVLAPYFPPNDPLKFTIAHRVFGASNIIKFLQEVPEAQRADAVSSMVYEANARLRDPVYGCAGAICHLQNQVNELQEQLAKAEAEIINIQCQNANLMTLICTMGFSQSSQTIAPNSRQSFDHFASSPCSDLSDTGLLDESDLGLLYEQSIRM